MSHQNIFEMLFNPKLSFLFHWFGHLKVPGRLLGTDVNLKGFLSLVVRAHPLGTIMSELNVRMVHFNPKCWTERPTDQRCQKLPPFNWDIVAAPVWTNSILNISPNKVIYWHLGVKFCFLNSSKWAFCPEKLGNVPPLLSQSGRWFHPSTVRLNQAVCSLVNTMSSLGQCRAVFPSLLLCFFFFYAKEGFFFLHL